MPKLVDIWRPDLPADGTSSTDAAAPWLRRSLTTLQRALRILHIRVENSAHLPGEVGGQTLYGGEFLELRGGTVGPPAVTGPVRVEASAFVFNEAGDDYDARFEGANDANLLVTDASTDRVGVGTSTPAVRLHASTAANDGTSGQIRATNTNAAGTSAAAALTAVADTASVGVIAWGTANTTSRWGVTLGGYAEVLGDAGNGLVVGTSGAKPLLLGTQSAVHAKFDSNGLLTVPTMHDVTGNTTTAQTISSGTYTPTITGVANIDSSSDPTGRWSRVGNVVTVAGGVRIRPTAASTFSAYAVSLPIASGLGVDGELGGSVGYSTGTVVVTGVVYGDLTDDRAEVAFTSDAGGATQTHFFHFTYEVK